MHPSAHTRSNPQTHPAMPDSASPQTASATPSRKTVRVWDPYTRLFHWALGAAVTVSFISVYQNQMEIHIGSGIVIVGLLTFRLLWGLFGSSTAQFAKFVRGPGTVVRYLKNSRAPEFRSMIGHNPLGALSVIALLGLVAVQAGTGLFASDDIYIEGPLEKFVTSETSRWATSIHKQNSNLLLGMIGLHIGAVLFYLIFKGDDLISPMVTGGKRLPAEDAERTKPLRERGLVMAGAAIIAAAAVSYYLYFI